MATRPSPDERGNAAFVCDARGTCTAPASACPTDDSQADQGVNALASWSVVKLRDRCPSR